MTLCKPIPYISTVPLNLLCRTAIVFSLLSLPFYSYTQVWINGYLKDGSSMQPIVNGEVRSSSSNTLSDSNGFFRLRVTEGDLISVKKFGYRFTTLNFSFTSFDSSLTIYMQPLGVVMKNVTVKSSYSAYQLDSIRRRMAFNEGHSKQTFISKQSHVGFGLVFNLDRITKSKDKNLKKQKELFEKTEQWMYIHHRFSDSIVYSQTGLSGDSLRFFMRRYTPSYEWLRAHSSKADIMFYTNDKMFLFRKEYHK
jgi:hypothetical protein